ncbi:MAG: hypothetical protein M3Q49_01290 [Actinomycetota bacterium]|jgi:3-dehydroquinate synthetase|nr:hypothetical protein [Actinomycetota bacterium]MDP9484426.1 hypothetical protein [Actinomycetota bacterium]
MLELPKGVWRWIETNARDLGRIATALETLAREAIEIRKALQEQDEQEEQR